MKGLTCGLNYNTSSNKNFDKFQIQEEISIQKVFNQPWQLLRSSPICKNLICSLLDIQDQTLYFMHIFRQTQFCLRFIGDILITQMVQDFILRGSETHLSIEEIERDTSSSLVCVRVATLAQGTFIKCHPPLKLCLTQTWDSVK